MIRRQKVKNNISGTRILYIGIAVLMAAVMIISAILFSTLLQYDRRKQEGDKLVSIAIEGVYSEEGGPWKPLTRQTKFDNWDFRDIIVRGHFTRDLDKGSKLFMNLDHLRVSLSVNGQEIYRLEPVEGDGNPTRAQGKQWVSVVSPGITTEDTVELNFGNLYRNAYMIQFDELLWQMYTGDSRLMLFEAVKEDGWIFAIGIILFYLTLFLIVVGLGCAAMKIRGAMKFFWLAMATLFSSMWFFTLSPAITLLLPWPVFLNVLYAASMQGIAVFLTLFVAATVTGWRKNLILVCAGVLLLTLFIGLANQILSIQDLYSAINYFSVFDLVVAICFLFCLGYENIHMKRKESGDLLKALLPLIICGVLELINGYVQFSKAAILLGIGMILFVICEEIFILAHFKNTMKIEKLAMALENELNQNRISLMLSQIRPHFLYNALNTIQYLCRTQPEKAVDVIADFSDYLRGNMDSLTQKDLVPFEQEIHHLEKYLSIECLRFPKIKISYHFQVVEFKLPCMTVQPLVENAIRYGLNQREDGGTVSIATWDDEKGYYLKVEDNGVGFNPMELQDDGRSHIGIINTRQRLRSMCNGALEIKSILDVGTCMTISIPKEGKKHESGHCR